MFVKRSKLKQLGYRMRKDAIVKRTSLTVLLLSLLLSVFCANSSYGKPKPAADKNPKQVILVIVNDIGLDDITVDNTPTLYKLANKRGAVGLMNTRAAGAANPVNSYLTLGTGVKAGGGFWGGLAFNVDEMFGVEKAGDIYESRTGMEAPDGGVVNLAIADVSRQSQQYKLDIYPGSLGKSLKEAGFKVGVLGNADVIEESDDGLIYHREAALIAMDQLGRVSFGNMGRDLTKDKPQCVGGLRTDYDMLFREALMLLDKVDFLVIETGDTARVDEFVDFLLDREIPKKKAAAFKNADSFIGRLTGHIDLDTMLLMVASPTPSKKMQFESNNLTPVILAGPNIKPGVLTSSTTRRHGIVDSIDVAPTIISSMGAQTPFYMAGRPLSGETQQEPMNYLAKELQQILIKAQTRVPVLTTYVTTVTIILILALLILLIGEKGEPYLKLFQMLLLWTIAVPLAMLLGAAVDYSSYAGLVLVTFAISIILVVLSTFFKKHYLYPVIVISLATCGALVLDTMSGAHLIQRSLLGYCPIIGARFYGIGNEYMGILIGSSVIGITLVFDVFKLRDKLSLLVVALLFAFTTLVIGYQAFGANVGGAIAAVVAFVVTFVGIWQGKVTIKHLLLMAAAVVLVIGVLAFSDMLQKGGNSHLGRAIFLIQKGGFTEVLRIAQRKLAMNIKGTLYTVWTRLLITAIVVFPTLFLRPTGAFARISKEYPLLAAGHVGAAFGAIAAFLFNDTGAAAAATIIVFSVVATLFIIIEEQIKRYKLKAG